MEIIYDIDKLIILTLLDRYRYGEYHEWLLKIQQGEGDPVQEVGDITSTSHLTLTKKRGLSYIPKYSQ